MFGASALHEEDAGLVPRAHQFLERTPGNKKARALSVLDAPRDMPIVIENSISLSRLNLFCFRRNVVHENVVRAFHVMSLNKHKSAGNGSKALLINPINEFQARGVELEKHGGH